MKAERQQIEPQKASPIQSKRERSKLSFVDNRPLVVSQMRLIRIIQNSNTIKQRKAEDIAKEWQKAIGNPKAVPCKQGILEFLEKDDLLGVLSMGQIDFFVKGWNKGNEGSCEEIDKKMLWKFKMKFKKQNAMYLNRISEFEKHEGLDRLSEDIKSDEFSMDALTYIIAKKNIISELNLKINNYKQCIIDNLKTQQASGSNKSSKSKKDDSTLDLDKLLDFSKCENFSDIAPLFFEISLEAAFSAKEAYESYNRLIEEINILNEIELGMNERLKESGVDPLNEEEILYLAKTLIKDITPTEELMSTPDFLTKDIDYSENALAYLGRDNSTFNLLKPQIESNSQEHVPLHLTAYLRDKGETYSSELNIGMLDEIIKDKRHVKVFHTTSFADMNKETISREVLLKKSWLGTQSEVGYLCSNGYILSEEGEGFFILEPS